MIVTPYFKKRYESLMDGCYKYYSQRECDATERARLEMNLAQPKTEHNYTEVGFKKIRLPKGITFFLFLFIFTCFSNCSRLGTIDPILR
jgi:hypothetical protein